MNAAMLCGQEVSPQEILYQREHRVQRRQQLPHYANGSILCFTLNIPGAVKQFPLAHKTFCVGLNSLRESFASEVLLEKTYFDIAGSGAFLACKTDPISAKRKAVLLENTHPLGRVFDIDVYNAEDEAIPRTSVFGLPRRCFICGGEAKLCARSGAHSMDVVRQKVLDIMESYFQRSVGEKCAECACKALLYEISVTPKPGLVDRRNSGAHSDMDYFTFLDSAATLWPWFFQFFTIGVSTCGWTIKDTFSELRMAGIAAERDMYAATKGVNTHKGIIFSFSILCGVMGRLYALGKFPPTLSELSALCAEFGKQSVLDFQTSGLESNGERCYRMHGMGGARGEAMSGFPTSVETGLPAIRRWMAQGAKLNDACVAALIEIIGRAEDTNLIKRGSFSEALERRREAKMLAKTLRVETIDEKVRQLDDAYIANNLSPGGAADILALSIALFLLQEKGLIAAGGQLEN